MATGAAQEMLGNIPCDICDTYKDVIWRCKSCPETLCNQCKIHHLKSRATKNHKVTELANVTEKNQSSSIFCPNHESEAFQMYCTTCDSLVCLRCITEIHKLHEYKMMEDIAKETKMQLENVFEQIKTNQIPKLEMSVVAITETQENYRQDKEKLLKSITTRGEDIKLAVDQIINKLRDESVQQATADETCLTETNEKIDLELTILKKQLNEEEQRVRNFSDVDMIVKAAGIKDSLTQLTKRSSEINVQPIKPPKFQIDQDNDNDLKKMVGQLMFEVNTGTEECKHDQAGKCTYYKHKEQVLNNVDKIRSGVRFYPQYPEAQREQYKRAKQLKLQYDDKNIKTKIVQNKLVFSESGVVVREKVEIPKAEDLFTEDNSSKNELDIVSSTPKIEDENHFIAHAVQVSSHVEARNAVKQILKIPHVAKASHNILAYVFNDMNGDSYEGLDDNGEYGAARQILKMMNYNNITNTLVIVSRWNPLCRKLGPKRFKIMIESALEAASNLRV